MKKPPVKSIRHKAQKRMRIPSGEEAGYEAASPVVQAKDEAQFPKNPIVHRGQDPELYWLNKYGEDNGDSLLVVDLRSLYRHEHIAPEAIIKGLYRMVQTESKQGPDLEGFSTPEFFGNILTTEELDKVTSYYTQSDKWMNRLIQGDSLLVMTSLLEREGMAEQIQCIYIDPPYGIKYGSNWQIKLNNRTVKDADDESLSGEPEQIKAFRDTWELGIHSYLSYLRDRLLVAKGLLHPSGSCFVQISDENVHLVRCLMDEVFGSENFVSQINVRKTGGKGSAQLDSVFDYVVWYSKDKERIKYRPLFVEKEIGVGKGTGERYDQIELPDGTRRALTKDEKSNPKLVRPLVDEGAKLYQLTALISESSSASTTFTVKLNGREFFRTNWKTSESGFQKLLAAGRIVATGSTLRYLRYFDDFRATTLANYWDDTGVADKRFVVQTSEKVIARCVLMTSDPGDLVLDPTCGSGTSAYVAEQWGRRWITVDTSRIALNIAKMHLMMATFPFYTLYQSEEGERAVAERKGTPGDYSLVKERDKSQPLRGCDVRYGFVYKKVQHITLRSIANNEPPEEETLYDQPIEDKKRLRVAGPFTVETLQNYEPTSPEELARQREDVEELAQFEDTVFEHLKSAGIKTGDKAANAVFTRIERLSAAELHAEGFYGTNGGEKKAYLHIGPKFGTVSKQAVTEAIKACRDKRDADWLLILGFAFESGITELSRNFGNFQVSIVRMHDDLLQEGLLKRDKKAASFVTIGEPDIRLKRDGNTASVEIVGLDIYDPIRDEVKSRDVHDINYWMLDDNYDGSNFVVRQIFFCGGDKDEFDEWKKGLSNVAVASSKKKAEQTLKIEIDDEAFGNAYGHKSRPFPVKKGQKIAIRVISQFGEETTKVLIVN
jgi:adenine-specific DNA-methyltransferase